MNLVDSSPWLKTKVFNLLKRFQDKGVLGINNRNASYVLRYNSRNLYPRVDNKLVTKKIALDAGLAVPKLYGVVHSPGQLWEIETTLADKEDFVVKPARGSGGEGILVVDGRMNNLYRKTNGVVLQQEEFHHYLHNILSGLYSLGGVPDKALIEYRVKFDPLFEKVSYQGVPDVRIVVFLGVPVMSMVRLPTRASDGKANLHQGAIGVGVDLATGRTTSGVWGNSIISQHPDTGSSIVDLEIPHWEELLRQSARSYEITGLGYQGVDLVLDKDLGPLLLEINARPGLNIQIANNTGLVPRLSLVEKEGPTLKNVEERIAFARKHFKLH